MHTLNLIIKLNTKGMETKETQTPITHQFGVESIEPRVEGFPCICVFLFLFPFAQREKCENE